MKKRLLSLALSAATALTLMTTLATSASAVSDLDGDNHGSRYYRSSFYSTCSEFYGSDLFFGSWKKKEAGTLIYKYTNSSGTQQRTAATVTAYYNRNTLRSNKDKAYTTITPILCNHLYFDGLVSSNGSTRYTSDGYQGSTVYVYNTSTMRDITTETLSGINRNNTVRFTATLYW